MPRMRILNASERTRLDHLPVFNGAELRRFFDLSLAVLDTMRFLRTAVRI